jgi:hypothetical protein
MRRRNVDSIYVKHVCQCHLNSLQKRLSGTFFTGAASTAFRMHSKEILSKMSLGSRISYAGGARMIRINNHKNLDMKGKEYSRMTSLFAY